MKILTISIAAYHVEDTIENALQSVLVPEILPFIEVLVCDDGGTDGTLQIAQRYEKEYPDVVRAVQKENGGYGSVLNTNIALARGKYFKQLDGDDVFVRDNMPAFIDLLSKIDADYVITAMIEADQKKRMDKFRDCCDGLEGGLYAFDAVSFQKAVNMHSSAYRTELLKNMPRKITEHCFYTDVELIVFPIPYIKTVYIWHTPIYKYSIGIEGQSISITGIKKHYKDKMPVFLHTLEVYQELESTQAARREFVWHWVTATAVSRVRSLFLFAPSASHYQEIREFCGILKENGPELFAETQKRVNALKIFTWSNGLLYPLAVLLRRIKLMITK